MANKAESSVLLFARAPVTGRVKTRLIPLLGEHGAAALYRNLADHTLAMAREAAVGPLELWCAPDVRHEFFAACKTRFGATLHTQCDGDLGARMRGAIADALTRANRVVLIGTDCPALGTADLRTAVAMLKEGNDAVFCPVEDGGYCLVGVHHAMPALFDAMPWGTGQVMEETRQRLRNLGWRWHELPVRWDLDRPEDYERLVREGWVPALDPDGEP